MNSQDIKFLYIHPISHHFLHTPPDYHKDQSTSGAEDVHGGSLTFIYPPRESKPTLLDGFSDEVWFEESMENKLSQKVERNNNLAVEIQGAVIFTKK